MDNFVLEPIADVERLSRCVTRVLGQNPGKFTLQGTNTYILGSRPPYILVDTGDGNDTYIPVLKRALVDLSNNNNSSSTAEVGSTRPSNSSSSLVSDVVITHAHPDHYCGLVNVLEALFELGQQSALVDSRRSYVPPRVHKFRLDYVPRSLGEVLKRVEARRELYIPPPEAEGERRNTRVLHELEPKSSPIVAPGLKLYVLATPGHTRDSVSLVLRPDPPESGERGEDEAEEGSSILTADTILGQGTAVFEDLAEYMNSLELIRNVCKGGDSLFIQKDGRQVSPPNSDPPRFLPGHGPVVPSSRSLVYVEGYIEHRKAREREILNVLSTKPPQTEPQLPPAEFNTNTYSVHNNQVHPPTTTEDDDDESQVGREYVWSIGQIVSVVYERAPMNLWRAAARGVWLHLRKVEGEGVVRRVVDVGGGESDSAGLEAWLGGGEDAQAGHGDGESAKEARRSEADKRGEEVWKSRWVLVKNGDKAGKL